MDLLLSRSTNTGENYLITNIKPRISANTTFTIKKLKFSPEDCFLLKFVWFTLNDLTNKLRILLSVRDFANHDKCVFSWPAWAVYGFAIPTKGSKPYGRELFPLSSIWIYGEKTRRMTERYVSWLTKYLFITEFCFDAIWVLSWVTKILIHGPCLHGMYLFPGRRFPTPAIWRSVTVARHVTRGKIGAVFSLKCDCKYWTNELKLSWPRKAYSFQQADSWYFANILALKPSAEYYGLLRSVVPTRSNSTLRCVFGVGLRCW